MAESFAFLFVVLVAVVGPFVLYALIRTEHDKREQMDRDKAEEVARRDTRNRK